MKQLNKRLSKTVRQRYFPLILILVANLVAGIFTFRDYGLSWDEPLFYQYADAVPYAYSISARLDGNFDLENAYGPSAEDHKIYGPIYLLLAKPLVDVLDWVSNIPRADLWHFVNFLTFQVGVLIFYALALRWMSRWAAFGAALLFSSQPVLWGHAWINPKDIPFTVFFLGAIYFGFRMVDGLVEPGSASQPHPPQELTVNQRRWRTWRKVIQILELVLIILALVCLIFSSQLTGVLRSLIHAAYEAPPHSLLGRVFSFLAANAQTVAEEAYINKGLILFDRLRGGLIALSAVFLIPAAWLTFGSASAQHALEWLARTLSPLPSRPAWGWKRLGSRGALLRVLLAGVLLGLLVSIRIIGPLAGALVCLYFFLKSEKRSLAGLLVYAFAALLAMYIAWPYLWQAPLGNFVDVLRHMSHNPKVLPVLFNGIVYPSDQLPATYLPVMLLITLTWPVWPLFIAGLVVSANKIKSRLVDWRTLGPILLWFLVPFLYVLILRPPMYDGYRHFLFLLPPVFILCGLAFEALGELVRNNWRYALVLIVLIVPGVLGLVKLHPYEYTYYNLLVGGTGGAYRHYETDFWLTCYKQLLGELDAQVPPGTTLFVHRQPSIAQEYASPGITIVRFDPDDDRTFPGSLLLLTTRANVDLALHPEAPELLSVGREGAKFCLVKRIP